MKWQRFSPSFLAKTRELSAPWTPLPSHNVILRKDSKKANVAKGRCEIPTFIFQKEKRQKLERERHLVGLSKSLTRRKAKGWNGQGIQRS